MSAPSPKEAREAERAHRRAARERLVELRTKLRDALAAKKKRVAELRATCKAERAALGRRIKNLRAEALARIQADAQAARVAAKKSRGERVAEARRAAASAIEVARVALEAEKKHQAELRQIAADEKRKRREADDAHARALLHAPPPATLEKVRPLLEKAATITPLPGESRVQALWRHAQAHPEEMHAVLEPAAERAIAKAREEIAETEKSLKAPNAYELKKAARIARMEQRAAKLKVAADAAAGRAQAISDAIPFGQPVLVGHHSEKRHRRDLEKRHQALGESVRLSQKAEVLERRAARAATSRAVSSDDPEAVPKLRAKLAELEKERARMRDANAVLRGKKDVVPKLVALGFDDARARSLATGDPMGRRGFPPYAFRNLDGNVRRLRERIEQLEAKATAKAPAPVQIGSATISEADNRVRVTFPGVPAEAIRRALKHAGFRWAPSLGAWQRHASTGAWSAARRVLGEHAGSTAKT